MKTTARPPAAGTLREILGAARGQRDEWVGFVERLALAESPSTVPEAQAHVLDLMGWGLEELGFAVRRVPGEIAGGLLLARAGIRRGGGGFQVMVGHSDTVWPIGALDEMPVELEEGRLRGPGVFDMKAGLAQILFALRILRDLGLQPEVEPVVLVNSDEEIGSPDSTRHIERLARKASRVFVLEPALDLEGRIKTARKGIGRFEIRVRGRSSHAGLAPERGVSAIQELSHVVQALHALTDLERGVVVNVGEIRGGTRPNVVAAEAEAVVDVRVNTMEEGREVAERIRAIRPRTEGCTIEVEGAVDRPPLERTPANRRLWLAAREIGEAMGLALHEGRAGGASDGNTTSRFTATLDGLGPVGDGAHARHEYVEVERTLERLALLAGLLLLPAAVGSGGSSGEPAALAEGP
jgi:glutamate carboxypeptidase